MSACNRHRFPRHCVDPDALTRGRTVEAYIHELDKQSATTQAGDAYHEHMRKKINSEESSSSFYFGDGGEFLRHCFLDFFGSHFSLREVWSVNADDGILDEDIGWDGGATTSCNHMWAQEGDPIYIQDKTTRDFDKFFKINDGSRIMNFVGSAAMDAISHKTGQKARFILWTTGQGFHHTLERSTAGRVEVISYEKITKLANNCEDFWQSTAEALA